MTIKIGDSIPDATLYESTQFGDFCPLSPEKVSVAAATKGKRVVIFGLPGAYTPTCSAKHVPGYVANADALRAKGVDEIWCISVNDGFVMAAWGREEKALGKVRFLGMLAKIRAQAQYLAGQWHRSQKRNIIHLQGGAPG